MTGTPLHMDSFKGFDLLVNESLDRYTSFRVGGPADLLATPKDQATLESLLGIAKSAQVPVTILGGGTNTLISDGGIRGLVILLTQLKSSPSIVPGLNNATNDVTIMSLAGERLTTLCKFALDNSLSGLEWAAGIPGTLGGAIMMNAGAHGRDLGSAIDAIRVLNLNTLALKTIPGQDLELSYRSLDLKNTLIMEAGLKLIRADRTTIKIEFEKNLKSKKSSQPVSKASGGCFFKNPSQDKPAGWLIEQAGLKGHKLRGAMVSDLHANFIINYDNATCKDILALKQEIQERVFDKFKIKLKAEVKAIGD